MNPTKKKSINLLNDAIKSAKLKSEERSDANLNELKALTETYLKIDDKPERVQLLKLYELGAELTGKNGIRKKLSAFDLGYFGRAYLSHYFSRPSPAFHQELDKLWSEGVLKGKVPDCEKVSKEINRLPGSKRVVAAPRGHAKSTNVITSYSIHYTKLYESQFV